MQQYVNLFTADPEDLFIDEKKLKAAYRDSLYDSFV